MSMSRTLATYKRAKDTPTVLVLPREGGEMGGGGEPE